MIVDENEKKKEEKNERLLVDLYEYYFLKLDYNICEDLVSICVPCLLKVTLNKEGNEETQKEVEMALLALSNIRELYRSEKELYLNEIKEIIQNHQKHQNLTRFAYQSAWQFLYNRNFFFNELESVIVNELHFAREARREIEDLSKCVDWKRKEEGKGEREAKEELILGRWLDVIHNYFDSLRLWNEESAELIDSIVQVFRASRDNNKEIHLKCLYLIRRAAKEKIVKIDELLKGGFIDSILEETQLPTLDDKIIINYLVFYEVISERLKDEEKDEMEEEKRKKTIIR
ncbi:uncharacterized protein MONOS_8862 [Monocercomonoides exilis]|uniref:uncharacterized protein n=1 Tax=Monocercomonoides exilis TaxID=2049356 RepID=UPI00355AB3F8|nr:hypothetical protein MONOS_8862 [Monocercomonoides exilis]|eukprot:MONOS_8862.1-p1 / transcript=MONOS_8862.1 / gene=MONOS_8862 / organism=Monocercomonoides_exilis_PA203 / gene_product=unspecified product / transcript_product=unspecified product / location=Mono_scaffold00347:6355-7496(-) / protein_length=288 / sequence_SO=supercontig / SO=protein_coding / is_pseudo=false